MGRPAIPRRPDARPVSQAAVEGDDAGDTVELLVGIGLCGVAMLVLSRRVRQGFPPPPG